MRKKTTPHTRFLFRGFAILALAAEASTLLAQDAGSILRENMPPPTRQAEEPATLPSEPATPAASQGMRFVLRAVRFEGNTVLPEGDLQALASNLIGQSIGIAELEELAARVTELYRSRGYFMASAVLQRQDVTSGIVTVTVIEGKVNKVEVDVDPQAPISKERVQAMLANIPLGRPADLALLERPMLLLSDLPGIAPSARVEAGLEAGTSNLIVEIKPKRRWDLNVAVDNHGSPSTGEIRLSTIARLNSPMGIGDNLDLRVVHSIDNGLSLARLGYELPVGTWGTRLAFGYTGMRYKLIDRFKPLNAHGNAEVIEARLSHPFIRSRQSNLFGHLSFEHKKLKDYIDIVDWQSRRTVDNLVAGINYEGRDNLAGGGYTNASLYATAGRLSLRTPQIRVDDAAGLNTQGNFSRFNYRLTRLQRLHGDLFAYVGLEGQQANKNLGSSEKMILGGPNAVRGYSASEGPVDKGNLISAELRYALPQDFTAFVFHDWGNGKLSKSPLTAASGNNKITLRSYGLGLIYSNKAGFSAKATAGWRDGSYQPTDKPGRKPWIYVQTSMNF